MRCGLDSHGAGYGPVVRRYVLYKVKCVKVPSPMGNLLSVSNRLISYQEGLLHALGWPVGGRK